MISRLKGVVWEKSFTQLVMNVNGVGYVLAIPLSTYDALPGEGDAAEVFVHTQVREDAIVLFGFATREERALFELLLTVSGIGGKLALSVLSGLPVSGFCRAIANKELAVLSKISGIGKRTAERLVVELHDKIAAISTVSGSVPPLPAAADPEAVTDAALALEQLGFKRDAALAVLHELASSLPTADQNSGNLLRLALQALNRG